MIIGAGLPTFLGNPIFEKFTRTSEPFSIQNFSGMESLNLVFNPIEKATNFSRYDVEQLFDKKSVNEIVKRSDGNPLHLKLLCSNMFDYFSRESINKMVLNREVMDSVMEYYSQNSENSFKIKNALSTADKEKLKTFSRVYRYEGFTFKAAVLSELAFDSIQENSVNTIKESQIDDFNEIIDLGMFELKSCDCHILELKNKSLDELAQISYNFIGDTIDKLYASYYYESATDGEVLYSPNKKDFEYLLTIKLADKLTDALLAKKINIKYDDEGISPLTNIIHEDTFKESDLEISLDKLLKLKTDGELSEAEREQINEINSKINLNPPAMILSLFDLGGYYLQATCATIRGKQKIIFTYIPFLDKSNEKITLKDKVLDYKEFVSASLDEYGIQIKWMYIYFIPKEPLLIIHYTDVHELNKKLRKYVYKREFETAVREAEYIFNVNLKFKDKRVSTNIENYNNYGFCLINVNAIDKALEIFSQIKEKYLVSNINYAFLMFIKENYSESKKILKSLCKKNLSENVDVSFIHLYIVHEDLPMSNKIAEDIPVINTALWNLALLSTIVHEEDIVVFAYLKKIKNQKKYKSVDNRVRSWVYFYKGCIQEAINLAKDNLRYIDTKSNLFSDVEKDISIFVNSSK